MTQPQQRTLSADDHECPCVGNHNPNPRELHVHHIVPLAWGGPDHPDNEVALCPTQHYNVHRLLRLYVKYDGRPPSDLTRRYSAYAKAMASRAWEDKDLFGAVPTIEDDDG